MPESAVAYVPRPDATPEAEASVLAAIYSFVIKSSRAKENAASMTSTNGGDANERSMDDSSAKQNYTG